jgi:hypothetical protein
MIEAYIAASRLGKPADPTLSQKYSGLYNSLLARIGDDVPRPEFFVTYSMNRICENVRIGGKKYIIYDQYMGQSIAQLNRILFFGKDPDELIIAYAFKYIAEEAFIRGNFRRAFLFAASHNKITERLGDARYSASRMGVDDRLMLGICQECFVIAHELAHQATDSPLFTEELVRGEWEDARAYLTDMAEKAKPFPDKLMSADHRKLHEAYRRRVDDLSREEYRAAFDQTLDRIGREIVPEMVSDRLACHLTIRVMREEYGISPYLAHLGSLLAFRYMRIFQYLRNAATFLRNAESWPPGDKKAVEAIQKDMLNYLMSGPSGLQSFSAWQVREKMLRLELFRALTDIGLRKLSQVDRKAQKHIFFCEENMDDEISYFLPFNIAHSAPLYHEARLAIDKSDLRDAAERLLGWV